MVKSKPSRQKSPVAKSKPSRQKSLKPLYAVGTAVYSAYWPPDSDPDRASSEPAWYPGVVTSYNMSKTPADRRYGCVRYYDVRFDDGDEMDDVADHFVMGKEEYLLHTRLGDDGHDQGERGEEEGGEEGGREEGRRQSWIGVRNVTDRKSPDMWAQHVGWYVASIDGTEHTHSLLSDALRAYDAWVVRSRGVELRSGGSQALASELNLPEEWEHLLLFEGGIAGGKASDSAALKDGVKKAKKKHKAELEQLRNDLQEKHDNEKEAAMKEASLQLKRKFEEEKGEWTAAESRATQDAIKEGVKKAKKKHKADLEKWKNYLQEKHEDEKEAAMKQALLKEQGRIQDAQDQLKTELNAQHCEEIKKLKKQFDEEKERWAAEPKETQESFEERIKEEKKKHNAELAQLKKDLQIKHDNDKEAAAKEASLREQQRLCEMQDQLKTELTAQHDREIKQLKKHFEEEKERSASASASDARKIRPNKKMKRSDSTKNCPKPVLEVGEEVYAAWWPDINDRKTASWFAGHVKSHREVKSDDGNGDYGPTRMYIIKYDDDGTELDVAEHFVFPKADYLLSTVHGPLNGWKGVNNVVDSESNDEYAKLVGWYIATIDGREESFSRLSDALKAYDVSVVRRKGDRTKRNELNLPQDWEWLFAKNGIDAQNLADKLEENLYDEEQVQERLEKEKEKLRRKLEKNHERERDEAVQQAVENERSVKLQMQMKLRDDLKEYYEGENARAAEEAQEEAQRVVEEAARNARQEHDLRMQKLRIELQLQHDSKKEEALASLREELQQQFRNEKEQDMVSLRGTLQQQFHVMKEKALTSSKRELQQQFQQEKERALASLRMELLQQFGQEKERALTKLGVELQQKFSGEKKQALVKLSQDLHVQFDQKNWTQAGAQQLPLVASLMSEMNQPVKQKKMARDDGVSLESPPPAKRVKVIYSHPPPQLHTGSITCSKQHKDQAAGEHTTEDEKGHQHVVATSMKTQQEIVAQAAQHHGQKLDQNQTAKFASLKIIIAKTVAQLVQNRNLNAANLTKAQLADAMRAGGFQSEECHNEKLQKIVHDKVKNGKMLTALIAKTAVSLARSTPDVNSHVGALSQAMQGHGFPPESVNNQQLRDNILLIAKDCSTAKEKNNGKPHSAPA